MNYIGSEATYIPRLATIFFFTDRLRRLKMWFLFYTLLLLRRRFDERALPGKGRGLGPHSDMRIEETSRAHQHL